MGEIRFKQEIKEGKRKHRKNIQQLEINTYEYLGPNIGISTNKLGMEFELVIYGPEAISKIQPYVIQGLN